MLIKPLVINGLEAAINRYLALGDNTEAVLAPLAGKVISITLQPFNETVFLCPSQNGIQVLDQYTQPPDTSLSGSLIALGLMGASTKPMRAIFAGKVTITGDMRVGHHFQRLFATLNIDLQSQLAAFTGAETAQKVGDIFRATRQWHADALENLKLNTREFLQEETRDLPAAAEADLFYQQIDVLRNDYDRLQARILRLQQQKPPHEKSGKG